MSAPLTPEQRARNKRTALWVMGAVVAMLGMAYASVPLYNLFCRVTGFDGTAKLAEAAPDHELARTITVKFNTDTAQDLPWDFKAEKREITLPVGRKALINFRAENYNAAPVTGTAVYSITPAKAGKFFRKIECFCFGEQLLTPGQKMDMPVVFFIDPAIADAPDLDDLTTITLSYSFFRTESERLEQALQEFYNQPADSGGKAGGGS